MRAFNSNGWLIHVAFGAVNPMLSSLNFTLERNEWESDFFGIEIGRLYFSAPLSNQPQTTYLGSCILEEDRREILNRFDLIQAKVVAEQPDNIRQLQQLGFQFVEGELDFCLPLSAKQQTEHLITVASAADIAELKRIFGNVFKFSRFCKPWFSDQQNRDFYCTWIHKAVLGAFDDVCLLQRDVTGRIQGMVSIRAIDKTQARVGLLAVAKYAQGRGMAKQLLQSAVNWCLQQQYTQLWVATQSSNQAAINVYQQQGQIAQISYWFYR